MGPCLRRWWAEPGLSASSTGQGRVSPRPHLSVTGERLTTGLGTRGTLVSAGALPSRRLGHLVRERELAVTGVQIPPLVEWKSPWLLCLDSFPGNQTKVYFRDICNKNTWAFSLHHTCFWTPFGDVYWAQMRLALQTVFSITWEKGSSYLHFLDLEKLDSWAELCKFGCYITLHVAIFVVLGDGPKSKSQPSQGLG